MSFSDFIFYHFMIDDVGSLILWSSMKLEVRFNLSLHKNFVGIDMHHTTLLKIRNVHLDHSLKISI